MDQVLGNRIDILILAIFIDKWHALQALKEYSFCSINNIDEWAQ